jgi:hypothetical protein
MTAGITARQTPGGSQIVILKMNTSLKMNSSRATAINPPAA